MTMPQHCRPAPFAPIGKSGAFRKALHKFARIGVTGLAMAGLLAQSVLPAQAQQARRIAIIRDAEIENLLRDYARPILRAAGLGRSNIQIVIVNDKAFNAFVADGHRIFINMGTLLETETPNEVIGVLAHETGHLAGNHLARLRQELAGAQAMAVIGLLAGIAAMAAGARAGSGDLAQAGAGIAQAGSGIAQRTLLAYQRTEEIAADRAAVSYLEQTRQSSRGMLTVFNHFADQTMFSGRYVDPYVLSHPMPRERITQIERLAQSSRYYDQKDPADLMSRHQLAQAKLIASTEGAQTIARKYPDSDTSLPAQYARALMLARFGDPGEAARAFDRLIARQPDNPYFWEAKGQMFFDNGKPREATEALAKAAQLAPDAGLIRILFGASLVETGNDGRLTDAIRQLEHGLASDGDVPIGYRYLGQAYARQGNIGMAELSAAMEFFTSGDIEAAKAFAKRAQAKLNRGTPGWLRADDILNYNPPRF